MSMSSVESRNELVDICSSKLYVVCRGRLEWDANEIRNHFSHQLLSLWIIHSVLSACCWQCPSHHVLWCWVSSIATGTPMGNDLRRGAVGRRSAECQPFYYLLIPSNRISRFELSRRNAFHSHTPTPATRMCVWHIRIVFYDWKSNQMKKSNRKERNFGSWHVPVLYAVPTCGRRRTEYEPNCIKLIANR